MQTTESSTDRDVVYHWSSFSSHLLPPHTCIPYLRHQLEPPFYPGWRFFIQNAGLIRGHDGRVNKAEEHGATHGTDAVLREALAHHLHGEWGEEGPRGE